MGTEASKLADQEMQCWQEFGEVFLGRGLLSWDWGKHEWKGQFFQTTGLGVSELRPSVCIVSAPTEGQFLYSWRGSLHEPCLSDEQATSPLCALGTLHIPVSRLYVHRLFAAALGEKTGNVLQALLEPSMVTFKTPGFQQHWLHGVTKYEPFCFPSQLLRGFVFPVCSPVC